MASFDRSTGANQQLTNSLLARRMCALVFPKKLGRENKFTPRFFFWAGFDERTWPLQLFFLMLQCDKAVFWSDVYAAASWYHLLA